MTQDVRTVPPHSTLVQWFGTFQAVYREELFREIDPEGLASSFEIAMRGGTVDDLRAWIRAGDEWHQKHDKKPFPAAPTRSDLLNGRVTAQGLVVRTTKFGAMPWWPACWAWLDAATRAEVAPQLVAGGDQIAVIAYPSGKPLYDEPNQFYSPDKFGPLSMTDGDFVALVIETIRYGFKGIWLFLGGDDGQAGYPIASAQVAHLAPVFATSPVGDLNQFVVWIPGWDGVWHKPNASGTGYTPAQIRDWSVRARQSGAHHLGIEGGTGYMLCGEGGGDYLPGGNMSGYDLLLLEFDDDRFCTGDVWQILARYLGPAYHRPPEQIQHDVPGDPLYAEAHDPHPIHVLARPSERGAYVPRVWEYFMYGFVRGADPGRVSGARHRFEQMGAVNVC
jgi:hypothetical protein